MTEGAMQFIAPLTFEAISGNVVLTKESESWANDNNHIDIGKWADLFVIAPATANTINKLSNGIADNLLTQSLLAYKYKKLIAPAANTVMYKNTITQTSLKMLKLMNYEVVEPIKKLLACGDEGEGALGEVEDIFYKSSQILKRDDFWTNRRVVVTGGGTVEKIDDVRYISNFSSGKMAKELSTALYLKGADVCLITTKKFNDLPDGVYQIDIESSDELHEYLVDAIRVSKKGVMTNATLMDDSVPELIQKKPYLFMAAAVSDYKPKYPQSGKMKKEMIGEVWNLELVKSVDILDTVNKDGIYAVGFKAEMDKETGKNSAIGMLEKKNLDAVCLNYVSEHAFGSDTNAITLFTKENEVDLGTATKLDISFKLLETLKEGAKE
jgi:phosphopantothenoylcysteine decarboxylase/phosphopantothenate--cysteine ligase